MTQIINGNSGNDVIAGTDPGAAANPDGIDIINGLDGNDDLRGLGGNDALDGGSGDDSLRGGGGADVLTGGAGIDFVTYDASGAGVAVDLAAGTGAGGDADGDTLSGIEVLWGSAYSDTLTANQNIGTRMLGLDGSDTLNGGNGDDILIGDGFIFVSSSGGDTLNGGAGNDILEGGGAGDTLNGGDGNDTAVYPSSFVGAVSVDLTAGTNSDRDTMISIENVTGSILADVLTGNAVANILDGNDGDDQLDGRGGADTLRGGNGTDTVTYAQSAAGVTADLTFGVNSGGDAQGDTLTGIENLVGSAFADILRGDAGANALSGGDGDDLINGYGGADAIYGGNGVDTVYYDASIVGVQINLATGTGIGGDAQGDTFTAVENVVGSGFADTLTGDIGANRLTGGTGADALQGGDGIDTASYAGSAVAVAIDLQTGTGSGGDAQGDTLAGIENAVGSAFSDILTGDAGANTLSGGAGNDTLRAGAGDDVIAGGDGNDLINAYSGADIIDGGAGIDTVYYDASVAAVTVTLTTGQGVGGDAQGDTLTGIENLIGSAFNDTLAGGGDANTLNGGAGNDVLRGDAGADGLNGGAGTDTASYFTGSAGVTVNLATGTGNGGDAAGDSLTGIENLSGSQGNDTLDGDTGANVLQGWAGSDVLRGGAGADVLDGGAGIDTASYFSSSAAISVSLVTGKGSGGEAAGDTLTGIENLSGSQANDGLEGDAGNNVLQGWNGADALVGGAGKDTLTGGTGADRFYFTAITDSVVGANADRITDFNRGEGDRIDLHLIDASTAVAGDQAFTFIGTALYTGVAGQLRYASNGSDTTIAGDINGDKVSDFHITLTGTIALQARDFVL